MFDPLASALTYLVTQGLKSFTDFLAEYFDFELEIQGWGSLFVAAFVAAAITWANTYGGKLPADLAAFVPYIVKVLLVLLPAIGIHATTKKLEA